MGFEIPKDSAWGKELEKWNVRKPYMPYPKMMYKAQRLLGGKWAAHDPMDERFSARCQTIVNDEAEQKRAHEDGYRSLPAEAVQFQLDLEKAMSTAAAEREYQDSKMSEKAQAEACIRDNPEEVVFHPELPELPRTPRRKKIQPVQEPAEVA